MRLLDFRFNYDKLTFVDRVASEGGEAFYPLLPVTLFSNGKSLRPMVGLLDSGSDEIVLPRSIATRLGLDLKRADPLTVVGSKTNRFESKVSMTIGRAGRICEPINDIKVSVLEGDDTPLIIGRDPIFKLYRITFVEAENRFEMTPYRGKSVDS
jgi:hypothetical protein